MTRFSIQAWNQPQGAGYGWARCSKTMTVATDPTVRFFVFEDGISQGEFRTIDQAKVHVANRKSWIKQGDLTLA